MSRPGRKTPRDPRESQLIGNYDSTNGVCPYAPAGGGGPGRFTSRKSHGDASATPFQTRTGPQAAKESSWITSLNEAFDEVGKAAKGIVEDAIEIERRAENVVRAYFLARYKYVWQRIFEETGRSLKEFLDGMIQGLLMMLIVVASTTALGTAAGAAIGALFGGVGAGPGALIGAEAGLNFGVFVLNWLGIGFLIVYVAANFGEVLKLVSAGVERAWYAGKRLQSEQTDIDEAAKDIARGIAVLFRLILEGIVMYLLAKGTAAVAERLPGLVKSLKDSKLGKGFAEWIEKNHKSLIEDPKTNPQLRKATTPEPEVQSTKAAGTGMGKSEPKSEPSKTNPNPEKIEWPPNRGFHGQPTKEVLKPGAEIDRYGFEGGSFTSPKGTPYEARALPKGTDTAKPYHVYKVKKPIEVEAGPIEPWFGEPGMGTQYELPKSISQLIEEGYLERIK